MTTIETPIHDRIHEKWESLYLDQGGALTREQRDQAFTEAMAALKEIEQSVPHTGPPSSDLVNAVVVMFEKHTAEIAGWDEWDAVSMAIHASPQPSSDALAVRLENLMISANIPLPLRNRAERFLRTSAPHHRTREWYQIIEAMLEAATLPQPPSKETNGEYICKCGLRVVPHRCSTGTEF